DGRSRPATTRTRVDLPAPLGPRTTQISPRASPSVSPRRAATPPSSDGWTTKTSRRSTSELTRPFRPCLLRPWLRAWHANLSLLDDLTRVHLVSRAQGPCARGVVPGPFGNAMAAPLGSCLAADPPGATLVGECAAGRP